MAKKSKSARALTGMRTLSKQVESGKMVWSPPEAPNEFVGPGNLLNSQWTGVEGKAIFYHEQYFDLSGYELDDLTLATVDARIQDPGVYTYDGAEDIMFVYDIYTQERMSEDDMRLIKENHRNAVKFAAPGMASGPQDREQIVFGMCRVFARNANIGGLPALMLNCRTTRFGSGNATAVQKLWAYRIVVFVDTPASNDVVIIPACTQMLIGNVVQEKELSYMMRLKRSYELSNREAY